MSETNKKLCNSALAFLSCKYATESKELECGAKDDAHYSCEYHLIYFGKPKQMEYN